MSVRGPNMIFWGCARRLAMLLLVAGLTACPPMNPPDLVKRPVPAPAAAIAAPVFAHGPGRMVTGPDVSSAVAPLSDEQAREIIRRELAANGIMGGEENVEASGVTVPARRAAVTAEGGRERVEVRELAGSGRPLVLDELDRAHHVAVKFVSAANYAETGGARAEGETRGEDLKAAAEYLRTRVAAGPAYYYGFFYDPLADPAAAELEGGYDCDAADYKGERLDCVAAYYEREAAALEVRPGREDEARARSGELLRAQVRDFCGWLAARGVVSGGEN
jgi:hypothetical protein